MSLPSYTYNYTPPNQEYNISLQYEQPSLSLPQRSQQKHHENNTHGINIKREEENEENEPSHYYYSGGEEYTDQNEKTLREILEDAIKNKEAHYKTAKKKKFYHRVFGFPAIALPLIYSPLSAFFRETPGVDIATVIILILSGLFSATHQFFDFSKKSQQHFHYEGLYSDLATDIKVELSISRRRRIPAIRFLTKIEGKYDHLVKTAPDL